MHADSLLRRREGREGKGEREGDEKAMHSIVLLRLVESGPRGNGWKVLAIEIYGIQYSNFAANGTHLE